MSPIERLSCKSMTGTDSQKTTQSARWQNLPNLLEHRDKVISDDLIANQVQIPLNTVDFSKTTREWRVLQPVMHRVSKHDSPGLPIYSTQSDSNRKRKSWLTIYSTQRSVHNKRGKPDWTQLPQLQPSPKKSSRQSVERRLSSSDEEAKSKAKAPTGPAQLKYRIHYDHQAKSLVLRVLEGRVSPTLYYIRRGRSHRTCDLTIGTWAKCRFQITS